MCVTADKVLLTLNRVSRDYEKGKVRALKAISLQVHYGDFIAVFGASGSGKSTLLNLITGLDQPTEGEILVDGCSPLKNGGWSAIRAKRVGFVFQSFNLIPTLTAKENVMLPMFEVGIRRRQRRIKAEKLLAMVDLTNRSDHYPAELSGGERQRVAIARGLANDPDLIVADEPTGNLDQSSADHIMELINDIHQGEQKTIILVTHEARYIKPAGRRFHICDGEITQLGKSEVV